MRTALTIAGSDSLGAAGIQADIKTMMAHGVYAMSVITAVTAQNSMEILAVEGLGKDIVEQQLEAVFSDIFPHAVKIGMVFQEGIIRSIANTLRKYRPNNVVLDPVMFSTSGSCLLEQHSVDALVHELLPLADLITPNLAEAEFLSGMKIQTPEEMKLAGRKILSLTGACVLVKGGHLDGEKIDVLVTKEDEFFFTGRHIGNPNTHGTGCTLSSAIASNLALGRELRTSVQLAKEYIEGAIADGLNLGRGRGPLNHMYRTHRTR